MQRLLLGLILLAACQPGEEVPHENSPLVDDLGRQVRLESPPERVVPLAPNLTELVAAVGAADRIAAISPADDHPPEVLDRPRVGTFPLDVERLVHLSPDLLLASTAINRPDEADRIAALGIPTYFFEFAALNDVPRAMRTLGDLLGTAEAARAAAHEFEARLDSLRTETSGRPRPTVLLLIGDETLYAFGGASYVHDLVEAAGGRSITRRFRGEGVVLSTEFVLTERPDVIVGAWGSDYDPSRFSELHPTLRNSPAVADGRVFSIDPDLVVRPGPRLLSGAEELATIFAGAGQR